MKRISVLIFAAILGMAGCAEVGTKVQKMARDYPTAATVVGAVGGYGLIHALTGSKAAAVVLGALGGGYVTNEWARSLKPADVRVADEFFGRALASPSGTTSRNALRMSDGKVYISEIVAYGDPEKDWERSYNIRTYPQGQQPGPYTTGRARVENGRWVPTS